VGNEEEKEKVALVGEIERERKKHIGVGER
jgi:hypothetical protein